MQSQIVLTLNLTEDSILLNEGVLEALDWPKQVQILINREKRMLLLRACSVRDKEAVVVPDEENEQVEISGRVLLRSIRQFMGWDNDLPRACVGEYLPAHQAVCFDLRLAETVELDEL